MTLYSGGIRASEVITLKPVHIESTRMQINIEKGKGEKQRYTLLAKRLLTELREYYRIYNPKEWLFPAARTGNSMCSRSIYRIYENARKKAGVAKGKARIHFVIALQHIF